MINYMKAIDESILLIVNRFGLGDDIFIFIDEAICL